MIGLPGATLDDGDIRLFRDTRAAGLILYRRNFESPTQLLDLLGRLEGALGRRLLVATDHEGGRIVMLGRGVTIFPDNLAVGTAGEETFAYKQGLLEARELRRLGVDLNLGPCLDVLTDRYSPNIGIRSYGKDPKLVARYGVARLRGMTKGGLSACPKHFPGKGHSPLDAHLKLPTITSDWDEMHAVHLVPFFEAIAAGVECVMTSHPVYPRLDPSGVPATFSRRIVDEYLRGEVGFRGVIVSDDLEMGAVAETCPIGEATVRTAEAGHDLLLVCHTEPAQRAAATALVEAYRSRRRPRSRTRPDAPRRQTPPCSSSTTRTSIRPTARCSRPCRRARGASPSCCCAILTTPRCWRRACTGSRPSAGGAASSRRWWRASPIPEGSFARAAAASARARSRWCRRCRRSRATTTES